MIEPRVLLSTRVKRRTMRRLKQKAKASEMRLSAYVARALDEHVDDDAKRQPQKEQQ